MLRALYNWTMGQAVKPHANWILGCISFIESSVFPIPPDVLLIPMVLANRAKAWLYATIATITSVLGGVVGYLIGLLLLESIAMPLLQFYGYADKFSQFTTQYNDYGAWIVLFAGITPFPFKVITIASGATQLSLSIFIISSIVARGLRFFVVAGLLYAFGEKIKEFIERYLGILFILFFIILVLGFVSVKYFM